jgi:membrane-bound lytic murein transglycosylase D
MAVYRLLLAGSLAAIVVFTGCPFAGAAQAQTGAGSQSPAVQQTAAQTPAPASANDRALIDSVEKAYQAGMNDYQQGHFASARANFDYAVDLMLKCNCDIRSDQAVSDEFDRIVDAVNTLELDALSQGSAPTPQAEPSPVDVAGNITAPASASVTAKAAADLKITQSDLPLVMNDYVAAYIDFFSNSQKGHGTIVASLERLGRYKEMIQRVLHEEGVPEDLVYQAVAESGFRPQAVNPKSGAGGMWQFMPWASAYGLERTAWVDQRFDPEEATRAYAREIKKQYEQLGDWYLAMAAYDWGAGNIQKAVQRTGYADFWELYKRNNLPTETKNYVPIILAVTIMAKNPKQYGLDDISPDPALVTDTVTTDYAVDLRLVSDIVGVPVQEIAGLNPSLLRMSTPPDESFELHLPAGTKDTYNRDIAEIPVDKRRYWRFHTVDDGDTLESIARTWHVSESELAFVNQLQTTSSLDGVDSLVIPIAPASAPSALRSAVYHPRRGDTLVTVADRFGVTVQQLRRWNHIRGEAVTPGSSLYVAEPAHISAARSTHKGSSKKKAAPAKKSATAKK